MSDFPEPSVDENNQSYIYDEKDEEKMQTYNFLLTRILSKYGFRYHSFTKDPKENTTIKDNDNKETKLLKQWRQKGLVLLNNDNNARLQGRLRFSFDNYMFNKLDIVTNILTVADKHWYISNAMNTVVNDQYTKFLIYVHIISKFEYLVDFANQKLKPRTGSLKETLAEQVYNLIPQLDAVLNTKVSDTHTHNINIFLYYLYI